MFTAFVCLWIGFAAGMLCMAMLASAQTADRPRDL
jgi:hypothetical protein